MFLLKGYRWRIGNENSIHMWKDPWIPSVNPPILLSKSCSRDLPDQRVSSLTINVPQRQNTQRLQEIYPTIAVAKILKVTHSPNPHSDNQFWIEEKNEIFSIRSAYKLITKAKRVNWGRVPQHNSNKFSRKRYGR